MKSRYRTWLAVPPEETEAVKMQFPVKWPQSCRMGSRKKLWYARAGTELSLLERWLPRPQELSMDAGDPVTEFAQVLENAGLVIQGLPQMDGAIHRVATRDDKKGPKVAHTGPILMVVPPAGTATTGAPMTVPQTGYFPAENNTILWPDCICGHSLSNSAMITLVNCSNSITNRPAMPAPILTGCHRQQHMNT